MATLEIFEIFSNYYFSYVREYKATLAGGNKPFKQININQMFDKIQMILMMKTGISNNRISRLN